MGVFCERLSSSASSLVTRETRCLFRQRNRFRSVQNRCATNRLRRSGLASPDAIRSPAAACVPVRDSPARLPPGLNPSQNSQFCAAPIGPSSSSPLMRRAERKTRGQKQRRHKKRAATMYAPLLSAAKSIPRPNSVHATGWNRSAHFGEGNHRQQRRMETTSNRIPSMWPLAIPLRGCGTISSRPPAAHRQENAAYPVSGKWRRRRTNRAPNPILDGDIRVLDVERWILRLVRKQRACNQQARDHAQKTHKFV